MSFNGPRIPGGVIAQLSAPQIRVEPGGHLRITLAEARRGLNKQRQEPTPTPPRENPKTTGCAFLRCNVLSLYGCSHDSSLEGNGFEPSVPVRQAVAIARAAGFRMLVMRRIPHAAIVF